MKIVSKQASAEQRFTSPDWDFVARIEDYAIFMLDPEGRVVTWNLGAERIKGYMAGEIVGRHFSLFYPPAALESGRPAHLLERAAREGHVEDEGWRLRKDGTRFWANVILTALRNEDGTLRGFAKITRDLTARVLAEQELRRSEERFRLLVETVQDYAIFMLDPDGRIATWNRGAQALKGYRADEIIGSHFSRFYPAEDIAQGKPENELRIAQQDGRVEDEGYRVRKDGTLFWANVVITALWDEQGTLRGYAKVTRDLSQRRAAEEQLRRSEERFRLLVESVEDYAMYMLEPTGHVSTWNAGAEKLKGYRADEIIGQHFSLFFLPSDVAAGKPTKELAIALAEGHFEEEGLRLKKDGSTFLANVTVTPIRDASGSLLGFAKVTRDLTARVEAQRIAVELAREQAARSAAEQAEAQVREAALRAETANRVKDEFLATVSHELRTPLNAIVGWSSLLRTRSTDEGVLKGIEVIHRNALAQQRIIEDILDVSRIITGKLRLDLKATDLGAVVQDAIEVVRPAAMAKSITLALDVPQGDCLLVADPERLRQVSWNLLSNAVKFTDAGGLVTVAIALTGSRFVLTVRDTGRGIDENFLPFVFDRFQQADSSATRRVGGLGLGLAIVRHLVELHGGYVRAASPGLGRGSTFTVVLPIRAVAQRQEEDSESTAEPPLADEHRGALAGRRVLVVDDEQDARELIMAVLEDAGAIVQTAHSVAAALVEVERFRPDVIVSDIGMPDEDGYSLIRKVKALEPSGGGVPSIALTAYTRAEDRTRALAMGFTTHIGKPVNPDDLVAAVANLAAFIRR